MEEEITEVEEEDEEESVVTVVTKPAKTGVEVTCCLVL